MEPTLDLPGILARIEQRLAEVGLSSTAASKKAGKPDAIRNIRRAVETGNRNGVSTVTLSALAPVLEATVAWLTTGVETAGQVPLVGFAGASDAVNFFADGQGPFDEVDAPDAATKYTVAVEVRGTSLGELMDGSVLFYDDIRSPITTDLIGRLCVVALVNGGVYVKSPHPGRQPGRYDLRANVGPAIYDVEIEWAARVTLIRPR